MLLSDLCDRILKLDNSSCPQLLGGIKMEDLRNLAEIMTERAESSTSYEQRHAERMILYLIMNWETVQLEDAFVKKGLGGETLLVTLANATLYHQGDNKPFKPDLNRLQLRFQMLLGHVITSDEPGHEAIKAAIQHLKELMHEPPKLPSIHEDLLPFIGCEDFGHTHNDEAWWMIQERVLIAYQRSHLPIGAQGKLRIAITKLITFWTKPFGMNLIPDDIETILKVIKAQKITNLFLKMDKKDLRAAFHVEDTNTDGTNLILFKAFMEGLTSDTPS